MRVHLHLQIHEQLDVFVLLLGILTHELFKRFSLDVVHHDRPLAVHFHDFMDLRNMEIGLLHARMPQCLIEYIRLGIILVKELNDLVTVTVDGFCGANRDHFFQFHVRASLYIFMLTVVSVQVHLLDLPHQRIARVGTRALIVKRLLGHFV